MSKTLVAVLLLLLCVDVHAESIGGTAGGSSRVRLTSNLTFFVDCTAGQDSNTGTSNAPWRTPAHAYDYARMNLDLAGQYGVTIRLLSNCSGQNFIAGPLVGQLTPREFTFEGDCTNPGAITVSASDRRQNLWYAAEDARFAVRCMTVDASAGGAGFLVSSGLLMASEVWLHGAGANAWVDVAGPRSIFQAVGPLTFLTGGDTNIGFVAEDHGLIILAGGLICSGAPTYGAFVQADLGGMIDATGAQVTHAACTGKKYNAFSLGIVFTGGSHDPDFFPGTSRGSIVGGYYD